MESSSSEDVEDKKDLLDSSSQVNFEQAVKSPSIRPSINLERIISVSESQEFEGHASDSVSAYERRIFEPQVLKMEPGTGGIEGRKDLEFKLNKQYGISTASPKNEPGRYVLDLSKRGTISDISPPDLGLSPPIKK